MANTMCSRYRRHADREFREKIDQLFRETHRIKGEAATLGLVSVETRAHDFEDMLNELRSRPQLSGSDFLPLVVRLDEMFGHLEVSRDSHVAALCLAQFRIAQHSCAPTQVFPGGGR